MHHQMVFLCVSLWCCDANQVNVLDGACVWNFWSGLLGEDNCKYDKVILKSFQKETEAFPLKCGRCEQESFGSTDSSLSLDEFFVKLWVARFERLSWNHALSQRKPTALFEIHKYFSTFLLPMVFLLFEFVVKLFLFFYWLSESTNEIKGKRVAIAWSAVHSKMLHECIRTW